MPDAADGQVVSQQFFFFKRQGVVKKSGGQDMPIFKDHKSTYLPLLFSTRMVPI